jgi:pyruvate, water dikinase
MMEKEDVRYVRWFDSLSIQDVPLVGGKNASLGEMVSALKKDKIEVPDGFAITADAYWDFLSFNAIDKKLKKILEKYRARKFSLEKTGVLIRGLFLKGHFSDAFISVVRAAYDELCRRYHQNSVDVAVRSSATAEDLPSASFAGQQETFLHIRGEKALLAACLKCYASLFTNRAISYREAKGFDHLKVALSIGIQKMVRSDSGGSGVMFTIDTETGFRDVVVMNASWGLGENVVQGTVIPDEYVVFKPFLKKSGCQPILSKKLGEKEQKMIYRGSKTKNVQTSPRERARFVLSDKEMITLAEWGNAIEKHYGKPMDIEWAKDGKTQKMFIVQARPETVQSQRAANNFKAYTLKEKGTVLCKGLAIGDIIVSGKVQVIKKVSEIHRFQSGSILVTEMTAPDWVPIMQKASAIITDHGGRTSHAAIVSRELGIPAIVGTNYGTKILKNHQEITLSCAEGDIGYVYNGKVAYSAQEISLENLPKTDVRIMMNIASPAAAFRWWRLPCKGIGLARMEFIINDIIQIHPMALVHFDRIKEKKVRDKIEKLTEGYLDKTEYFVDHLAQGIGKIAASRYPYPVIVRMSDFKTNEYANLIGGNIFEPKEENPMLGFRGASRYYNPRYKEGFALECRAIKKVRDKMGFTNVVVMIPFCRTLEEADQVLAVLRENGLERQKNGLEVYVMAEIPSNIILADAFADRFDGFSIGSNDLTQLLLGIDRDSEELSPLFDERNPAVKKMIRELIDAAHRKKRKVGICGQAPSDYPEFAQFLAEAGIDSISLNPDSVVGTIISLAKEKASKIASIPLSA